MTVEAELVNTVVLPFGGGAVGGFLAGYALKKIMKLAMIVSGAIIALLFYLQSQGFLSLNWDKISSAVDSALGSVTNSVISGDAGNQVVNTLGIPMGSGIMVGFIAGFSRG